MVDRGFFEQVSDVVEGAVCGVGGTLHSYTHGFGLKVWFDDANREHYEAQLVRVDGARVLEIGFHSEHPKVHLNEAVLVRMQAHERHWRKELGKEPVAGPFLGAERWRRISEVWEEPAEGDVDAAIEVGARLSEYVLALEPWRRA